MSKPKSPFNAAAPYEEVAKLPKERAVRNIIEMNVPDAKAALKKESDLSILKEVKKREKRKGITNLLAVKIHEIQPQKSLAIKVDEVTSPDLWQPARDYYSAAQRGYKFSIACQVMVGFQLISIKKELGYTQGRKSKEAKRKSAECALFKSFEEHVTAEIGISKTTAYVFIKMALGAKSKLKSCYEKLPLLEKPFTDYSDDELKLLDTAVNKITDGETQKSLIDQWKFSKAAQGSALKGGATTSTSKPAKKKETVEQLAFAFITPTFDGITEMRLSKKYKTYLHTLPIVGDSEAKKPGLVEVKAQLESMAEEIGEVMEARKKEALTLTTSNQ